MPAPDPPAGEEGGYRLPPLDLLHAPAGRDGEGEHDAEALARVLVDTLADFHIRGEVVDIVSGPVITMFELKPAPGIKVSQIQNLADDLAMAMRAQRIRVVAPIPGKGAVGIEIPNAAPETVVLREIVGSALFRKREGILPLPLGKDTVGRPVVADLAGMPHLLIAGATGSGKSVSIHCLVTGFLYRFPPEELSLIMIDPKMLELGTYNGIPHLLVPVVTDAKEAVKTLKWAVREMEERYTLLSSRGVRSIPEYNRRVAQGGDREARRLPYLVIIIDELADLILTMQNEVEEPLARLAQMARGVGIHLILATQRPSVDVITGMIKANFPSRISFRVATKTDSRTILDANGAEKLLGKGDMLYLPGGSSSPVRIHGAFISGDELEAVVAFVRGQLEVWQPEVPVGAAVDPVGFEPGGGDVSDERDALFDEAVKIVIRYGHGSTSLLQRRLKIGYTRAARIVDQLEAASVVGPPDGSKAREVMVDESYLEEMGIQ
jgi:S-DNA-T family DNA segregation ATPase FtsK/SpoIIIE